MPRADATDVFYVRETAESGGDGTVDADSGEGSAYAYDSIATALSSEAVDFSTKGAGYKIAFLLTGSFLVTSSVNVGTGFSNPTSAKCIIIDSAAGQEHLGVFGDGTSIDSTSAAWPLYITADYTEINNVETTTTTGSYSCIALSPTAAKFNQVISDGGSTGVLATFGDDCVYTNCIGRNGAFGLYSVENTTDCLHCLFHGNTNGARVAQFDYCVSVDNSSTDYAVSPTGDHNTSEDAQAPGANSVINVTPTDEFVDFSGGDFNLKTGASAKDIGGDSGVALDITLTARDSTTDAGPFEFIAAASGNGLILLNQANAL